MHNSKSQPVTSTDVWKTWFPLALSWLMMGIELPLLSAVVARLANPEVNLGAYGGVVFPLSLLIEAPIIMLLTASTKLSRDLASYKKLWLFMMIAGGGLSALHLLVAVTPLFDLLVGGLLGVESDILEASRLGMIIMTPWTWAIAHRGLGLHGLVAVLLFSAAVFESFVYLIGNGALEWGPIAEVRQAASRRLGSDVVRPGVRQVGLEGRKVDGPTDRSAA